MSENPETARVVANRRKQLRRWIEDCFDGSQAAFIESTSDGERQLNQGELSGLLRQKSFGEKRARSLEQLAKMPTHFLDATISPAEAISWAKSKENDRAHIAQRWPFALVTLDRVHRIHAELGPKKGSEALHDIDRTLEIVVLKWEREIEQRKRVAG